MRVNAIFVAVLRLWPYQIVYLSGASYVLPTCVCNSVVFREVLISNTSPEALLAFLFRVAHLRDLGLLT